MLYDNEDLIHLAKEQAGDPQNYDTPMTEVFLSIDTPCKVIIGNKTQQTVITKRYRVALYKSPDGKTWAGNGMVSAI